MLLNVSRAVAVCDDCRTTASDDYGDICLYFDEAEAFRQVTTTGPDEQGPWDLLPPLDLVCPVCTARRRTAELDGGAR